ncbi:hypothetical protein A0H81_07056 [Grifola frondosa]|uniref:Uncharacterized protein n=1 Tax=Grifola frondosa TaxID=5627 RepID=A0A1C7M8H8_GRIFR|nr:hypothetical protein A0H81_07056 [Grifola frondosa]
MGLRHQGQPVQRLQVVRSQTRGSSPVHGQPRHHARTPRSPPPVIPAEPTWDNSPEPDEPETKDPEEQWPADAPTCVYCWQKGCDTNCDSYKNYAAANAPLAPLAPLPPSPFVAAPLFTIPSPYHPTLRTVNHSAESADLLEPPTVGSVYIVPTNGGWRNPFCAGAESDSEFSEEEDTMVV